MATRANIIVGRASQPERDAILYRHWDAYPKGVSPTLDRLCEWCRDGLVPNDPAEAAAALIRLGPHECTSQADLSPSRERLRQVTPDTPPRRMKRGSPYERTTGMHGDIEHAYFVDCERGSWAAIAVNRAIGERMERPNMPADADDWKDWFDLRAQARRDVLAEWRNHIRDGKLPHADWNAPVPPRASGKARDTSRSR